MDFPVQCYRRSLGHTPRITLCKFLNWKRWKTIVNSIEKFHFEWATGNVFIRLNRRQEFCSVLKAPDTVPLDSLSRSESKGTQKPKNTVNYIILLKLQRLSVTKHTCRLLNSFHSRYRTDCTNLSDTLDTFCLLFSNWFLRNLICPAKDSCGLPLVSGHPFITCKIYKYTPLKITYTFNSDFTLAEPLNASRTLDRLVKWTSEPWPLLWSSKRLEQWEPGPLSQLKRPVISWKLKAAVC